MSALDLADAKTYLNISDSKYDTELQLFIDAAESAIAQRVGPLSSSSLTKRVPGYAWNLHLPVYPAVSLTSVTPVGSSTALTLSGLYLEQESGAVSFNGGSFFSAPAYDVAYTVGRADVPPELVMAVRELLRHMWTTQRGSTARPNAGTEQPGQAYTLPNRVLELTAPYELLPGIA